MSDPSVLPAPLFERPIHASLAVEHLCDMAVDLEAPHVYETPMGTRLTYVTKLGVIRDDPNP